MYCIKQCLYASKCKCFLCIAKINFIDIDLICVVTAQMSYYCNSLIKYKNLTQNIMDTFRKNGFLKGKNAHKM